MHGFDATKSTDGGQAKSEANRSFIGVRLLAHPAAERVGEYAVLFDAEEHGRAVINRHAPSFRAPDGRVVGPLASTRITRTPLQIDRDAAGLRVSHEATTLVEIDGAPLRGEAAVSAASLEEGVVILFGRDVALWIGRVDWVEGAPLVEGMVGDSSALRRLRRQIAQVADLEVPVLIRGETGVGKELVARAVHLVGRRRGAPYLAVNVAALTPHMAAAELFGHKKSSFTGAVKDRKGYFEKANRGTLFLDEIGDATWEVQALLLRVAQFGEIQPVGGAPEPVDVRLVAATDADLDEAVERRTFREPLRQRFAYELFVPPLRARRDDIGVLFHHLLRQHLGALKEERRLPPGEAPTPFVPASLVAQLARLSWPGNVRELDKAALRFALDNRGHDRGTVTDELRLLLARAARPPGDGLRAQEDAPAGEAARPAGSLPAGPRPPVSRRSIEPGRPEDEKGSPLSPLPSEAELLHAHQQEGYSAARVARRLGVSRSYVDRRLSQLPQARKVKDLSAAEIEGELARAGGDSETAARALRISARSLRLHLARSRESPRASGPARRSDAT